MPTRRLGKTKNDYESWLYTYVMRRAKMQYKKLVSPDFDYVKATRSIRRKIKTCTAAIRKFQDREERFEKVNNCAKDFFGISLKGIGGYVGTNKQKVFAKGAFYKCMLDSGVNASYIAVFCGIKNPDNITRTRRSFQKSFSLNKENRDTYHKFLKRVKECQ